MTSANHVVSSTRKGPFGTLLRPIRERVRPKVELEFQKGPYLVKTATTKEEFRQAFALRYHIFHGEFSGETNKVAIGLDRDRFDKYADLLIIKDVRTGSVVGTYRFLCSRFSQHFYSATEFEIGDFLHEEGAKIELSRACIHRDHRSGSVINLLWRGIFFYLRATNAQYVFGCSSMSGRDPREILAVMTYLQLQGKSLSKWNIFPKQAYDRSAYLLKGFNGNSEKNALDCLPPLFRAYLNAGAMVEVVPAFDAEFNCYDFFTVLEAKNLEAKLTRKFGSMRSDEEA